MYHSHKYASQASTVVHCVRLRVDLCRENSSVRDSARPTSGPYGALLMIWRMNHTDDTLDDFGGVHLHITVCHVFSCTAGNVYWLNGYSAAVPLDAQGKRSRPLQAELRPQVCSAAYILVLTDFLGRACLCIPVKGKHNRQFWRCKRKDKTSAGTYRVGKQQCAKIKQSARMIHCCVSGNPSEERKAGCTVCRLAAAMLLTCNLQVLENVVPKEAGVERTNLPDIHI